MACSSRPNVLVDTGQVGFNVFRAITSIANTLAFAVDLSIHLSMFIYQKCKIRHMEHTLVQSKSEWCNKTH